MADRPMTLSGLLRRATTRARVLRNQTRSTALHDFRTSVRALRSLLEFSEDLLNKRRRKSLLAELKRCFDTTTLARDAEVQLALGEKLRGTLPAGKTQALQRLETRLKTRLRVQMKRFDERWLKRFEQLSAEIAANFEVRMNKRANVKCAAGRFEEDRKKLKKKLRKIHSRKQAKKIHQARIAAKSLRYLLETDGAHAYEKLQRECERLQDVLGKVHDVHVFRQTLAREKQLQNVSGYDALKFAVKAEGGRRFRKFKRCRIHL